MADTLAACGSITGVGAALAAVPQPQGLELTRSLPVLGRGLI